MAVITGLGSVLVIALVLLEAFEAMVLPRRVTRSLRFSRLFYRVSWAVWRRLAPLFRNGQARGSFYSVFGPLSLLCIFMAWGVMLVVAFGLLHWSLGTAVRGDEAPTLESYLYFSGTTFFTLGFGDIVPVGPLGRALAVVEAGLGFGFIALVIGYMPALTQAFSTREVTISLLDARAGSPPSAAEFLLRLGRSHDPGSVDPFLAEWERWAAMLLESHLSYPALSFYRSQHDNQSWLAALTAILDICALSLAALQRTNDHQTRLTFAMCRHAVVDLALVFRTPPTPPDPPRLSSDAFAKLLTELRQAGFNVCEEPTTETRLAELRQLYEPFVTGLAGFFQLRLPAIVPPQRTVDNWQTSAWTRRSPGIGALPSASPTGDDHFA